MTSLLGELRQRDVLGALDVELARALGRLTDEQRPEVLLAVALASRQTREGHVCVELDRFAGAPVLDFDGLPVGDRCWPERAAWRRALESSPLVRSEPGRSPLVLDESGRLYLCRYYEHERRLAELLLARALPAADRFDRSALANAVERLFPRSGDEPDWQRVAAELAVVQRLTVVTGGPGTGKTSTVVKILALLVENALALGAAAPRIALLAPTGKAATRLGESIARAKASLPCSERVRAAIAESPSTVHRELGAQGEGGTRFRRGAGSPLTADVVVVDESSMVDVALMRRLLEAVAENARLILLGDEHQLASVEAGAVLGDICRAAPDNCHSRALSERVREAFGEPLPSASDAAPGGIGDSVVRLLQSHRFSGDSVIGKLAGAVQRGEAEEVLARLDQDDGATLIETRSSVELVERVSSAAREGFLLYLSARDPDRALAALERFRILCAHRRGPEGSVQINAAVERALDDAGLFGSGGAKSSRFYPGRPLLVTRNDYSLGLFNGDVGVVVETAEGARAFFVTSAGPRYSSPARLPPHETVFATTIHKSQGSEFDEVAIVLPRARSPLLTRELLYTGITRARRRVVVFGSRDAVRQAVEARIQRATGLTDQLTGRRS